MARNRENIVYHNMRMNLDNEQHRRIHMILMNLNTSVHKSVNQFLIDATDAYIKSLEGSGLTNEEETQQPTSPYVKKEELDKIRMELKDELQKEMIIILGSALAAGKTIPVPEVKIEKKVEIQKSTSETEDTDEMLIDLASSWG